MAPGCCLPWQAEYDTVAIALQTRLDGKEYKSREISDSFRDFKREVRIARKRYDTVICSLKLVRRFQRLLLHGPTIFSGVKCVRGGVHFDSSQLERAYSTRLRYLRRRKPLLCRYLCLAELKNPVSGRFYNGGTL